MVIRALVVALALAPVAAAQEPAAVVPAVPYRDLLRNTGPVRMLTLSDAVAAALRSNLSLELERSNLQLVRERTRSSLGYYDPIITVAPTWSTTSSPTSSTLQGGAGVRTLENGQWGVSGGWQQNLLRGGSLSTIFNGGRITTNDTFVFINPLYSSSLDVRLTQPLLRGFLQTPADRQIRISRLDERIADSQFRQKTAELVFRVVSQYWQLVLAFETHEAIRQARELAAAQYLAAERRAEAGLLSSVSVLSARAEVMGRDRDLAQADVAVTSAQNALKELMASGIRDAVWQDGLVPEDRPDVTATVVPLAEAIETALTRRPELEQVRLTGDQAEIDRRFQANERRPALNVVVAGTSSGRTGIVTADETVLDAADPSFGGFGKSARQTLTFAYPAWNAGLELRLPIGNRSADAGLATAEINKRRVATQQRSVEQAIFAEVRNIWESLAAKKRAVEAAMVSRQVSEEQLTGQTARFEAGFTTAYEVLQYQRDLTAARVEELRAQVDYGLALTALQQAMNTLVDESGVVHTTR